MINAAEIRVGNWVCTVDTTRGTVKSIGKTIFVKHALGTRGYLPDHLFPIEVYHDVLPLCGFQPVNAEYIHKDTYLRLRYHGAGNLVIEVAGDWVSCEYVHELQNIFFDATGRLLEPNLYGI